MYICNIALAHYHVRMYSAHVVCKRIFYIQTNLQMLQHLNIYAMLQNDVFWWFVVLVPYINSEFIFTTQ